MTIIAIQNRLIVDRASLLPMPSIRRSRPPVPPPEPMVTATIHRQPVSVATDAQSTVCEMWRGSKAELPPSFAGDLAAAGLLRHCSFLSAERDGPLVFRRIADATVRALGTEWARQQLGKPNEDDPHSEYALQISDQYAEAIEGGEPVHNLVVLHGLPSPIVYSHMLIGWTSPEGQKALLSCVSCPSI
ncbi:hypothetical protein FW320_06600 [Azospirillum sp. Vi22]|nr:MULTISPECIES: hypothetical protein [Azospirillum]NUB05845.1 hypothetical protein [Azospirillum baldaniorum]